MTQDDLKLICIRDSNEFGYTVFMKKLPGIVVEVDEISKAPEAISNALHDILMHGITENWHFIGDINGNKIPYCHYVESDKERMCDFVNYDCKMCSFFKK